MILPRYGERSLCEVTPSLLAALGAAGFDNVLGVERVSAACLLVIDGLGWDLLHAHADEAPFLARHAIGTEPVTAGFPSTTATSVSTFGTGLPSGQHGIVGYSFAAPELLYALPWRVDGVDARETLVPEEIQPLPTAFERAGVDVTIAAPMLQRGSGLTRSVLRGGVFEPVFALGDLSSKIAANRSGFCYAYHGDLDTMGHLYGPGSDAWRWQLNHIDRLIATVVDALPPGALLAVTADHGMVEMKSTVDFDTEPRYGKEFACSAASPGPDTSTPSRVPRRTYGRGGRTCWATRQSSSARSRRSTSTGSARSPTACGRGSATCSRSHWTTSASSARTRKRWSPRSSACTVR